MPISFESRFVRDAGQDPQRFAQAVQQRYGHPPATVSKLLAIGGKLAQPAGGTLSAADVAFLKQAHPTVDPGTLDKLAKGLNEMPARVRAQVYTGLIAGDMEVIKGNLPGAGADYREVESLMREHTTQAYADAINAKAQAEAVKRNGGKALPERQEWKPEPGSTRDLIEQQMKPRFLRDHEAALDRGDPNAVAIGRHALANRIERAADTLEKPTDNLRESVSAAYTIHDATAEATETFGITGDDPT